MGIRYLDDTPTNVSASAPAASRASTAGPARRIRFIDPPVEDTALNKAAAEAAKLQDSVIGPLASASDKVLRAYSSVVTGSEVPAEMLQKGVGAVAGAIQKGGEYIAEKGGEMFPNIPAEIPAAAGFVAANAPYMIPMGRGAGINTALKPIKGQPGIAARLKQMRTGVEASAFEQFRRDPTAFFSTTSRQAAGERVGAAKQAAGISTGVTSDIRTMTPDNLARARNVAVTSNKAQSEIVEKIEALKKQFPDKQFSPQEVVIAADIKPSEIGSALEGINKRLSRLERSEGRGSPSFQQWSQIKTHFQTMLDQAAPEVRQANKEFSRVALRDKFMEPLPVNQSGTMSKISTFGFTPAVAGVGAVAGGPIGAVLGAATVQAARSPFVAGLGTATRGLIDKLIDPSLSATANQISRRPLLIEYARQRNKSK